MKGLNMYFTKYVGIMLAMLFLSASVYAGKGGNSNIVGSIEMIGALTEGATMEINGKLVDQQPENYPWFGSEVGFLADWSGSIKKSDDIYVYTKCLQNNVKVYGVSSWDDTASGAYMFILDNRSGKWDSSELANCSTRLERQEKVGRDTKIHVLDYVDYTVSPVQ